MNCPAIGGQSKSDDMVCGEMKNVRESLVEYGTTDDGCAEAWLVRLGRYALRGDPAGFRAAPPFQSILICLVMTRIGEWRQKFVWQDIAGSGGQDYRPQRSSLRTERTEAIHG